MKKLTPQEYVDDIVKNKLPELTRRLEQDPRNRGGRIIYFGNTRLQMVVQTEVMPNGMVGQRQVPAHGLDLEIEDKNGRVSTFYIDPVQQNYMVVQD